MIYQHFKPLRLKSSEAPKRKRRYSITADILSFERCSLQYGTFNTRKYEPGLAIEMFYGTIIHQVLDKAHAHFKGEVNKENRGVIPTDSEIQEYFLQVEKSVTAHGLRPVSSVRDKALDVLIKFNRIEGPSLYKRVLDTECKLQVDKNDFVLHGNVDVLAVSQENSNEVEIWDYKGAKVPSKHEPIYQQYEYQMQVYAELYRKKTGIMPKRAVLYFLNELGDQEQMIRPANALVEVPLKAFDVDKAMQNFESTVKEIEHCRSNNQWTTPKKAPPEETCDGCDLRWNCLAAKSFGREYNLIFP